MARTTKKSKSKSKSSRLPRHVLTGRLLHGVSIEFVENKKCYQCGKSIIKKPALYAFLWRGTPSGQSSYYHLGCVRKRKPILGRGVDRATGKEFKNELHYSFNIGSSLYAKVNIAYIQQLLSLDKVALYQECLGSNNLVSRANLLRSISLKFAKQLGVETECRRVQEKTLSEERRQENPITGREVVAAIRKTSMPKDYVVYHDGGVSARYEFRIRRRLACVGINSYSGVYVRTPSLTYTQRRRVIDTLNKSSTIQQIKQVVIKQANSFQRNKSYIALASRLGVEPAFGEDIRSLKGRILETVLKQHSKDGSTNKVGDLIALLVDPNELVRTLAKSRMRRLIKPKKSLKSLTNSNQSVATPTSDPTPQLSAVESH